MSIFVRVWCLALALSLTACGSGNPGSEVARAVLDRYYQAQLQQDLDKAMGFFSSKRAPEDRRGHVEKVQAAFGKLTGYTINQGEVNTILRGRLYIFEVQAQYDTAGTVQEIVTMFNEVGSEETSIVGHTLNAEKISLMF